MPPLETWLIRHGESTANAGKPTQGNADIPLTALGAAQFTEIAAGLEVKPDKLVTSPFLRARDSAAFIVKRWPDLDVETWPIQEFTYLSPSRCLNTTNQTRQPLVKQYWQSCDPDYVDGPDAESFNVFMLRLRRFHQQLMSLETGFAIIVGHGQFFSAYKLSLRLGFSADPDWMRSYRATEVASPLRNGEITRLYANDLIDQPNWRMTHIGSAKT